MFVRVDEACKETIEGYSYENEDGDLEYVIVDNNASALIKDSTEDTVTIFPQDIPKLIKALQAAYDHIQKGK